MNVAGPPIMGGKMFVISSTRRPDGGSAETADVPSERIIDQPAVRSRVAKAFVPTERVMDDGGKCEHGTQASPRHAIAEERIGSHETTPDERLDTECGRIDAEPEELLLPPFMRPTSKVAGRGVHPVEKRNDEVEATARSQDADALGNGESIVADVLEGIETDDMIEAGVGERQRPIQIVEVCRAHSLVDVDALQLTVDPEERIVAAPRPAPDVENTPMKGEARDRLVFQEPKAGVRGGC